MRIALSCYRLVIASLALTALVTGCSAPRTGSNTNTPVSNRTDKNSTGTTNTVPLNTTTPGSTLAINDSNSSTSNQTVGNQHPSDANGSISFPDYLSAAMQYVTLHSTMKHLFAPTQPGFNAHWSSSISLAANAEGTSGTQPYYNVSLIRTSKPYPFNAPALSDPKVGTPLAEFGAIQCDSNQNAVWQIDQVVTDSMTGSGTPVDLSNGITGREFAPTPAGPYDVINWREGKWTLQVYGGSPTQDTNEARQIVSFLAGHFLPMTTGTVVVDLGDHPAPGTSIQWVFGSTVYRCNASDPMLAVEMAVSMREYPNYRIVP